MAPMLIRLHGISFFQIWAKLHRWAKLPGLRYVKPDLSRAEFQQLKSAHPGIF